MSWFTKLRDSVESLAVVAGNYFVPGSSALTSHLTSEGSQDQLNSTLGQVAQFASGVAGGYNGNSISNLIGQNPASTIVSGGSSFANDAAGPGMTYDMFGEVIPNEAAASTYANQVAQSTTANIQNGLSATGGLTPAQYASASQLAQQGMSATDIAKKLYSTVSDPSQLARLAGVVATGLGTAYTSGKIGQATNGLASASTQAAGILAPAISNAAGIQSNAATDASKNLAAAATQGAQMQADGATGAANTLASSFLSGAEGQYKSAMITGNSLGTAATQSGDRLSAAQLQAAAIQAAAQKEAAAQKVAGYNEGIKTADSTLGTQTDNQKPYMQAGTQALSQLMEGLKEGGQFNRAFTEDDMHNSEAYKFALGEGTKAINNGAAAGGMQLSSANLESLGKYAAGTASQYQQQAFNQWMAQNNLTLGGLQNMVNTGQVSVAQLQSALAQHGISVETLQGAIGQANADGTIGAANATANGMLGSANALSSAQLLSEQYRSKGINDASAFIANGGNAAAAAGANGQAQSANYLAGGVTSGANALASGEVAAAGYNAAGITGAANATAQGLTGAANANAAGTVAQANTVGAGISNIGQQIAQTLAANGTGGGSNNWLASLLHG